VKDKAGMEVYFADRTFEKNKKRQTTELNLHE